MLYSKDEFLAMVEMIDEETSLPLLGKHGTKAMGEHDAKLVEAIEEYENARMKLRAYLISRTL